MAGVLFVVAALWCGQVAQAAPTNVACVGDSITGGYPFNLSGDSSKAYPTILGKMLGAAYHVSNFGENSLTLQKDVKEFSYWTSGSFKSSTSSNPDIVLIMLGTNDAKPYNWNATRFTTDYKALIEHYATLKSHPVVYVLIPCPGVKDNYDINVDTLNKEVIPLIRKIAADNNVPIIDVNAAFAGKSTLIGDGIHPTADGYVLIATTVFKALTTAAVDGGADGPARNLDGGAQDTAARIDAPAPVTDAALPGSGGAGGNGDAGGKDGAGGHTDTAAVLPPASPGPRVDAAVISPDPEPPASAPRKTGCQFLPGGQAAPDPALLLILTIALIGLRKRRLG